MKPNYPEIPPLMQQSTDSLKINVLLSTNTLPAWFTENDCECMFGVQQAREKLI